MPLESNFDERLRFSRTGEKRHSVEKLIEELMPGTISVKKATRELEALGIDWTVVLAGGAEVNYDTKERERGSSRWWRSGEPELALETWSVVPSNGQQGKIGWTLNQHSRTDFALFLFHPYDSRRYYSIPFQALRAAFERNLEEWTLKYGPPKPQSTERDGRHWKSECLFVPASVVLAAVDAESMGSTGGQMGLSVPLPSPPPPPSAPPPGEQPSLL